MKTLFDSALAQHERNKNALISLQTGTAKLKKVIEMDEKNLMDITAQTEYMSREEIELYKKKILQEMTAHKAELTLIDMKIQVTDIIIAASDSNLRESDRCLNMVSMAKLPWA